MPQLVLHGRPVATVFDLLGRDENDMTYALGYGLTSNRAILRRVLAHVAPGCTPIEPVVIELQRYDHADAGYTDLEILTTELHVLVEAKRGWEPPSPAQLRRYEDRFVEAARPVQRLVVLTQNGAEMVVRRRLGAWRPPPSVIAHVLGWADLVHLARGARGEGSDAERRLARDLAAYLGGLADMREIDSNSVFVVSLTDRPFDGWPSTLTPIDVVERFARYFYPATSGWPRVPPNYIAFRWGGVLRSIHHVDAYTLFEDPHSVDPAWPALDWGPHFLLTLGPAIRPSHEVRNGESVLRAARVWADIDLLLTAGTITAAVQASRLRRAETSVSAVLSDGA